jgi:hypothetical protein
MLDLYNKNELISHSVKTLLPLKIDIFRSFNSNLNLFFLC